MGLRHNPRHNLTRLSRRVIVADQCSERGYRCQRRRLEGGAPSNAESQCQAKCRCADRCPRDARTRYRRSPRSHSPLDRPTSGGAPPDRPSERDRQLYRSRAMDRRRTAKGRSRRRQSIPDYPMSRRRRSNPGPSGSFRQPSRCRVVRLESTRLTSLPAAPTGG